ncbi:MAG: 3-deoxy-8-phosphooctulonate synthase [Myxococcales bacterium]|nr:3-deoxy-8-phosphooctulonate synthase [Myxococcales bacterium]
MRPGLRIGPDEPLALIGGPCVVESDEHLLRLGDEIQRRCEARGISFILKASFDKANRTSIRSYRGPGIDAGLRALQRAKEALGCTVLTDIHGPEQAARVAEVVDVLQIPAFLCRQTDLLVAAAATGRVVNIKKGQFVAPEQMRSAIEKVRQSGNARVLLTERGSTFGYNNLVVDIRALPQMSAFGVPVVFDATHSLQLPGALGDRTGGQRELIAPLARAAAAAGIDALFVEIHDDPDNAPCDGPNMLPLAQLDRLLDQVTSIHELVRVERFRGLDRS